MQVLDDVSDSYQEQQVNFKMELSGENTLFLGDSMFVYRIVQNLLVNAIKYSMDGTRIFIKTFVQDKKIFLQVLNTTKYPIEVDANDLKEKFVRGDKSRSTEGNGLGLAIVDAYVQALGGNFTIDVIGDTFKASIAFDMEYVA
jgi:signal transduction histidine kinase